MGNRNSKKILLVEDDPFLVDIYTTKFKEDDFGLEVASDGEEALDKIIKERPDLVLLDIVLPRLDGIEILRKVKNDNNLKQIKIIVLSNLSQNYEISRALDLGAASYLIKSHYSPSEVVQEVKKILNQP